MPQRATGAANPGTIAYVRSDASSGTEIRLIEPDGRNDHRILALPYAGAGWVPTLAWKPDATELAFSSAHEETHSLYTSDIYAIRPDGSNLRRLTNGPDRSKLASYPKGVVTVDVSVGSGGPYIIYVAGAAEPQIVTTSRRLTFTNVADFGPGRLQFVVAMNGFNRWIDASVSADVQPGQSVYAGQLAISGSGDVYTADKPTWRSDGSRVGFTFGRGVLFKQVPAYPADGAIGDWLVNPSAVPGFPALIDWSPTPAKANQLLYDSYSFDGESIYLTTEGNSGPGDLLTTFDDLALDLKWLPDGSGFLAAVKSDFGDTSNIYEYDFATQQLHQLTYFSNEIAGHLSIAPDGQTIVFEHAATLTSPTDLWLMNRDGSNIHELVKNASRPAWSKQAPHVPTITNAYVPLLVR